LNLTFCSIMKMTHYRKQRLIDFSSLKLYRALGFSATSSHECFGRLTKSFGRFFPFLTRGEPQSLIPPQKEKTKCLTIELAQAFQIQTSKQ